MFFWAYWMLEIPSTISVHRRGARWVFCRILVLWGPCAILMGFMGMPLLESLFGWLPHFLRAAGSRGRGSALRAPLESLGSNAESQFYFLRFMLGFFEGGFFPTVVMYLSIWFKAEHRAKAMASFMAAMPLAIALGSPASQWISDHVEWGGLAGWRWIFILEGSRRCWRASACLFCLPDRPQTAEWMPTDERDWLLAELETEHRNRATRENRRVAATPRPGRAADDRLFLPKRLHLRHSVFHAEHREVARRHQRDAFDVARRARLFHGVPGNAVQRLAFRSQA